MGQQKIKDWTWIMLNSIGSFVLLSPSPGHDWYLWRRNLGSWHRELGITLEVGIPLPEVGAHPHWNIWMFPKIVGFHGSQIIRFNRAFQENPSILGLPYFWKHPYLGFDLSTTRQWSIKHPVDLRLSVRVIWISFPFWQGYWNSMQCTLVVTLRLIGTALIFQIEI